jgi:multidrug resistance efflux pump
MGEFSRRWVLTGEVVTAEAVAVVVPAVPIWPISVRYLIEDGQAVEAGDKIAEFDGTQLADKIGNLEARMATATNDLEAAASRAEAELAELELALAQKRAARDVAAVEARLPEGLVPARERAEKALALERAELELKNAEAKLDNSREAQRNAVALRRLDLDQAREDLRVLRENLDRMVVRSPVAGIFLAADSPREPRPVQAGDDLWPGLPIGRLPSAAGWQVEARLLDVDDGKIAPGQAVLAYLDGAPGRELHGRIRRLDEVAQEISRDSPRRAFSAMVEIEEFATGHPEKLAGRLRPGMAVRVEVLEPKRRAPLLPRRCLAGWPAEQVDACAPQVCALKDGAAVAP